MQLFLSEVEKIIMESINDSYDNTVLKKPLKNSIGGKMLRTKLVFASLKTFRAGKKEMKDGALVAAAIELVHNYSLVHDDIMDKDDTRRGLESIWKEFGVNTAILSGNYLMQLGIDLLMRAIFAVKNQQQIYDNFSNSVKKMLIGQSLDINGRTDDSVLEYKTGALFEFCASVGGLFVGACEYDLLKARDFGRIFGLLFQKKDDALDLGHEFEIDCSKVDFCESLYFKDFFKSVFK